jgi:hypothetical protein
MKEDGEVNNAYTILVAKYERQLAISWEDSGC